MARLTRSTADLYLLAAGVDDSWSAFLDGLRARCHRIAVVGTWPETVRHLVAHPQVRNMLLGYDLHPDLHAALRQIVAMRPGIHVFVVTALPDPALPPWVTQIVAHDPRGTLGASLKEL